jgi:hypothetical protein
VIPLASVLGESLFVGILAVAAMRVGERGVTELTGRHGSPPPSPPPWVLHLMAGWIVFHLLLTALQAVGVAWSPLSLTVTLGGAWLLAEWLPGRGRPARPWGDLGGWRRPDAADAVVLAVTALFAAAALTLRSVHPDFIFHWAVKGERFALAGGVDFAYLSHPWNHYTHPDYPTLLPEIYAVTLLFTRHMSEPVLLLWAVLTFAALLAVGRHVLSPPSTAPDDTAAARGRGDRLGDRSVPERSEFATVGEAVPTTPGLMATAVLATGLAAFAIGYVQAGGADLGFTLALLAAWPALAAAERTRHHDVQLAVCAAFAAALKIEGVVLAGVLVFLYAVRPQPSPGRRPAEHVLDMLKRGLRVAWLPALVIVPWALLARRHGLFLETNTGALDLGRLPLILRTMADTAATPEWHALPLVLLALPLLLLARPTRWPALAATLQLGFYLTVYLTTPVDPEVYILTSFARLLLGPVTVALTGCLLLLTLALRRPTRPPRRTG